MRITNELAKMIFQSPETRRILKPVQIPPRGQRELDFYEKIFSPEADSTEKRIRRHLPKYFGTKIVAGAKYLVLEDVSEGFDEPNVLGLDRETLN